VRWHSYRKAMAGASTLGSLLALLGSGVLWMLLHELMTPSNSSRRGTSQTQRTGPLWPE